MSVSNSLNSLFFAAFALLFCVSVASALEVGGQEFTLVRNIADEQYNFSLTILSAEEERMLSGFDFVFAVDEDGAAYRLTMRGRDARLDYVNGRVTRRLAQGRVPSEGKQIQVEVRRRRNYMSVLFDGEEVLWTLNAELASGGVGIAPYNHPITVRNWRYQQIADIRFSDDFIRGPEEKGPWDNLAGRWMLRTTRESETAFDERRGREIDPERSANFFTFTGLQSEEAGFGLTAAGFDFWDSYHVGASINSSGGPVGLAFFIRDAENYYVVRWWLMSMNREMQPLEVVRVKDGQETVLGRVAVEGAAEQWYHMEVSGLGKNIRVRIDGHAVLDIQHDGWNAGRAGMYIKDADDSLFDDFVVTTEREWPLDTSTMTANARNEGGGNWHIRDKETIGHDNETGRFEFIQADPTGSGFYWLGEFEWQDYSFSADLRNTAGVGAVGLAVREGRDGRSLIFRSGGVPSREGVWSQLALRHTDGTHRILAEGPGGIDNGESRRVMMDLQTPGIAEIYVDDELWLRAEHPLSNSIRPGFYTLSSRAEFVRPTVVFGHERQAGATVDRDLFAQDRFMAGWASDRWSWIRDEADPRNRFWHQSDFYGRFELDIPLTQGAFTAYLASEDGSLEDCYKLQFRMPEGGNPAAVDLSRRGEKVAEAEVDAPGEDNPNLVVIRDGYYIIIRQGSKELVSWRDDEPLTGSMLGMQTAEARLENLAVRQYNIKDYLFEESPRDWKRTGTWEVTTRFTCDPRWSWMGATQWDGLAAIWNKHQFVGDVTVEFYAGMRMASGQGLNYPRPGDINVTISASEEELGSGYTALISAWDPLWSGKWSYIKRRNDIVAASDRALVPQVRETNPTTRPISVEWDPGGRPIHGAWYNVRLRKRGNNVRAYFDNVQVLEYNDPTPLDGGMVAFWTQHNSIMVARVRIAYEDKYMPAPEVKALPATGPAIDYAVPDPTEITLPAIDLVSNSHPGVYSDFEYGFDGWRGIDGDQGAYLERETENPGSGNASLRIVNRRSGGSFGAVLDTPLIRPHFVSDFDFLYNIDPDVKVNFYLDMSGRKFFIQFTGPDESSNDLIKLGSIDGVKADGEWHRASFPLAAAFTDWLTTAYLSGNKYQNNPASLGSINDFRLNNIKIGNYHEGYLKAGFGGNSGGATLILDEFRLVSVGPADADFAWNPTSEDAAYSYSFVPGATDASDNHVQPEKGTSAASTKADEPGLWHFTLREHNPDGEPRLVRHAPFRVEIEPLEIASMTPEDGGKWGGGPIRLKFDSLSDAALSFNNIGLRVNNQSVSYPSDGFRFDFLNSELLIDPNGFDEIPVFSDGDEVNFALSIPRFSGDTDKQWSLEYALEADNSPPTLVTVKESPYMTDFAGAIGDSIASDNSTILTLDDEHGRDGEAIKITAASIRSPMNILLRHGSINAAQYPVLTFDYRIESGIPIDVTLHTAAGNYQVRFTDVDSVELIGRVPDIVADGSWRTARLNIHDLLSELDYTEGIFDIRAIRFSDTGYTAIAPGTYFHLDNIELVPVVSSSSGLTLNWEAKDSSGIAGYSFLWSGERDDQPDRNIDTEAASYIFNDLTEGWKYFHIRAVDKAGNWGPSRAYRFIVDNTSPKVIAPEGDDQVLGESLRMRVESRGPTGLNLSESKIAINGEALDIRPEISKLDERRSELVWRWVQAIDEHTPPVEDGSVFEIEISGIKDSAGNIAEPAVLRYKVDYAADNSPPAEPFVRGDGLLFYDNFTRSISDWRPHQPGTATDLVVAERNGQGSCLEITNKGNASFGVYAPRRDYRLQRYPYLSFDYRFPEDIPTHIVLNVDGRVYSVKLTEHRNGYVLAGEVDGFTADDQWRHLRINLKDIIEEHHGERRAMSVRWIFIGNMINRSSPAKLYIDNFAIFGPVNEAPSLTWVSQDITGIAGYSLLIDAENNSVPNEEIDTDGPEMDLETLEPGDYYLHIRARDGAGNWGTPSHVPIVVAGEG